jgi:exonuclease SbcD
MAIKILVTADLHLGKRSSGLSSDPAEIATRHTWLAIVDYAVQNKIDVLLLCGDIIDRENRHFESIGPLQSGFAKLGGADVEVFMVAGNHDYNVLPEIVSNGQFPNVHLLGKGGRWELSTFRRYGQAIQFAGWSFPLQLVRTNPLAGLTALPIDPNIPCIGLLHADINNLESRYGPVSLVDLQNTALNIWMVGHIHGPINFPVGDRIIRYPGSPQALSAKEPGIHGALLLTVEEPYRARVDVVPLSTVRYERLDIDISAADSHGSLGTIISTAIMRDAESKLAELENVLYLVYDIRLVGQHPNDQEVLQWTSPILEGYDVPLASGARVSVRTVTSAIKPTVKDLDQLALEQSPAGILAQTILAIREGRSTPLLDDLVRQWNTQFREVNGSSVYQPLNAEWQKSGNPRVAVDFVLQECNKLLGELLLQRN